jgi:hypothetical protein
LTRENDETLFNEFFDNFTDKTVNKEEEDTDDAQEEEAK